MYIFRRCMNNTYTAADTLFCFTKRNLTKTLLFSGLAAKVYCQSGFAPSTAGFHQTPSQTPHSERHPGLIESVWHPHRSSTLSSLTGEDWEMEARWQPGCSTVRCPFSESWNAAWRPVSATQCQPGRRKLAYNRNECHRVSLKPH